MGVGVWVDMRVLVVQGARVGGLVPFCGVNFASGVTGMAAGGGFWVVVVWSSHATPWAEGASSAEIGKVVDVVILFVVAV